jgi:hypothetical protein
MKTCSLYSPGIFGLRSWIQRLQSRTGTFRLRTLELGTEGFKNLCDNMKMGEDIFIVAPAGSSRFLLLKQSRITGRNLL